MTVGSAVVSAGIRTGAEQNASSNGGVAVKIGGISFGDVDIFVNEEQIL
ncbi:hypothetical protein [Xanthomonas phage JGB6]|nr:hypothetical protein [Xanthomonas phage JGB6]